MYRNLRTFSSFSRSLFRPRSSLLYRDSHVSVQRVRVVRPIVTWGRIRSFAIFAVSFTTFSYFIDSITEEEEDSSVTTQTKDVTVHDGPQDLETRGEGEEEYEGEVEVPDETPEDAWFIPLGWARQMPPTFYKGSDPEWQSFVDFSKDKKKNAAIRHDLAGLVGDYISNMKQFQKFLGSPIQTRKYWLDVDFPDGPPPEYERAGLEITDDYVAWTVRPVSPLNISRLQSTLWPEATFSSFWASSYAIWQLQVAKVKDFLNIKSDPGPTKPRFPPGYVNLPRLMQPKDKDTTQPNPQASHTTQIGASPAPSVSLPTNSERGGIWWPLPAVPKPGTEMSAVTMAFKKNLAKNWKSAEVPAPRGTFMVSGLVELQGSKAVCVMDVRAAYHPRESRWVVVSMGVRRIQRRKQGPRGGQ